MCTCIPVFRLIWPHLNLLKIVFIDQNIIWLNMRTPFSFDFQDCRIQPARWVLSLPTGSFQRHKHPVKNVNPFDSSTFWINILRQWRSGWPRGRWCHFCLFGVCKPNATVSNQNTGLKLSSSKGRCRGLKNKTSWEDWEDKGYFLSVLFFVKPTNVIILWHCGLLSWDCILC